MKKPNTGKLFMYIVKDKGSRTWRALKGHQDYEMKSVCLYGRDGHHFQFPIQ